MNCKWCGKTLANNDDATDHAGECEVMNGEKCPNEANHTPTPTGYVARAEWAEKMMETHKAIQCPDCGLWAIWVVK